MKKLIGVLLIAAPFSAAFVAAGSVLSWTTACLAFLAIGGIFGAFILGAKLLEEKT